MIAMTTTPQNNSVKPNRVSAGCSAPTTVACESLCHPPRMSSSCIFCRIAAGEIPASFVLKEEQVCAFLDTRPVFKGHVLVIPTDHLASLNDAKDPRLLGGLLAFAREVARAEGIAERGYRVVVNTNPDGGQTVFHLHLHLLGGRPMKWPPG